VITTIITDDIASYAAQLIGEQLRAKPKSVLGLATGSTPISVYDRLIEMVQCDTLSFKNVVTFNLDEYHPIQAEDPQSYMSFMREHLFDHIDIDKMNIHIPNGMVPAEDVADFAIQYEKAIGDAGGIDLQVLGIGSNGHIAFNEPPSEFDSRTRYVSLTDQTIADNARFFERREDVPIHAITMGIGTILAARRILMLATGPTKAMAIKNAIEGSVSTACPASALQLHRAVTVVIDANAAALLMPVTAVLEADETNLGIQDEHHIWW